MGTQPQDAKGAPEEYKSIRSHCQAEMDTWRGRQCISGCWGCSSALRLTAAPNHSYAFMQQAEDRSPVVRCHTWIALHQIKITFPSVLSVSTKGCNIISDPQWYSQSCSTLVKIEFDAKIPFPPSKYLQANLISSVANWHMK